MSEQNTDRAPFFQPLKKHDTLQTAHLLWKMSDRVIIADGGCWEWVGAKTSRNYGNMGFGVKNVLVHRLIYSLCVGDLDKRLFVCHKCDNPPCCNPDHLFVGSPKDNTADMFSKGRNVNKCKFGEDHANSRFTNSDVLEIRSRHAAGDTIYAIAKEYGCTTTAIWHIVKRKTWKHLP